MQIAIGNFLGSRRRGPSGPPELIINGGFTGGVAPWVAELGSVFTSVSGQGNLDAGGTGRASQSFTTEVGKTYRMSGDIIQLGSSFTGIRKSDSAGASSNNVEIGSTVGSHSNTFVATATTTFAVLQRNTSGIAIFDNISCKEVVA